MSARPRIAAHSEPVAAEDDGVRWLAMLIRQGLLLIVRGIEKRYGWDPAHRRWWKAT